MSPSILLSEPRFLSRGKRAAKIFSISQLPMQWGRVMWQFPTNANIFLGWCLMKNKKSETLWEKASHPFLPGIPELYFILTFSRWSRYYPLTQMRKLRFREVNWHSQEYRAQTAPTWKLEDAANSRYWLTCLKFPFLARLPGSSTPNMKLSGLVLTLHMGSLLPLPFWCPHCLYEIRESNPSLSAVLSPLLKTGQEE